MMELFDSAAPLTREEIDRLESQLGVSFPEDYIEFILKNNGGEPEEDWLFDFNDGVSESENTSVIRGFYKFYLHEDDSPSYDDLVKICNTMWKEKAFGRDMVAIADDPGGNPICMCVSGENFGKVYFADHEFEDTKTGYLFMSEVAPSFSAFMDKLYADE